MDTQSIRYEELIVWNRFEFALNFLYPCSARIERLVSQLDYKLKQGQGELQYTLGLDEKGESIGLTEELLNQAISTMRLIASKLESNLIVLSKPNFGFGKIAKILIRKCQLQTVIMDIRVAILGQTQVGKSTLIGVLSKGVRENGKGSARNSILRHLHEKRGGSTATVTQHLVGFDYEGKIIKNNKK